MANANGRLMRARFPGWGDKEGVERGCGCEYGGIQFGQYATPKFTEGVEH